jgi:hypothetical protein
MVSILLFGFLIGMSHALEADHLAAVGAMSMGEKTTRRRMVVRGAAWGLGHTITLFAISSFVLIAGFTLTDKLSAILEFSVGVMLILLGMDVMRRMYKKRIHFHAHKHDEGKAHIHAHSHIETSEPHGDDPHEHEHPTGFPLRAMFVGLAHGAAGSAGLLALVIAATQDVTTALLYVLCFGIGSIIGMAALSLVVSWPLSMAEKHALWLHRSVTLAAAVLAIVIGASLMFETGAIAFAAG